MRYDFMVPVPQGELTNFSQEELDDVVKNRLVQEIVQGIRPKLSVIKRNVPGLGQLHSAQFVFVSGDDWEEFQSRFDALTEGMNDHVILQIKELFNKIGEPNEH